MILKLNTNIKNMKTECNFFFKYFGQMFARRGLIKIDELKQLENISSSLENSERKKIFREATLKV